MRQFSQFQGISYITPLHRFYGLEERLCGGPPGLAYRSQVFSERCLDCPGACGYQRSRWIIFSISRFKKQRRFFSMMGSALSI